MEFADPCSLGLTIAEGCTEGRGCGSTLYEKGQWPTPKAWDGEMGAPRTSGRSIEKVTHLGTAAKYWPTPRAGNPGSRPNGKGGKILAEEVKKSQMWPTPQSRDFRTGEGHRWETPDERSRNLNDAVAFEAGYKVNEKFPTPKSRDWKGKTQRGTHAPMDGLCNTLDVTGGQLNPTWVEALMGWPPNWTSLDPMPREVFDHWLNNHQWEDWEPDIPRIEKGVKDRVNRLKAIGNGQVPICVYTAWRLLSEIIG